LVLLDFFLGVAAAIDIVWATSTSAVDGSSSAVEIRSSASPRESATVVVNRGPVEVWVVVTTVTGSPAVAVARMPDA
jgi:hypothetical protein